VAGGTRFLVVLAAVGAAALVAASALAIPGEPKVAIVAADQAHAKNVLLKKAELPGKRWTAKKVDFRRAQPDCLVKNYSLAKLTATGQAGTEFTREVDTGTFLVDSIARVFRTSTEAVIAVKTRTQLGAGKCLGRTLVSEAPFGSKATSSAKVLSLDGLALPSKGFEIVVKVTSGTQKYTLTGVVIEFRRARTVTELSLLTINKGWSKATLRSVAALLAKRTAKT
jgi:hypothetical protein